ncbi:MAG: flagellar protein FlgN [Azoarcus sp.]|jgi:flagella synthesis protein FlgN|nr:flagellar protein FlgN [Azoarcus sp.]
MQTPAPAELQRLAFLVEAEAGQLREFLDLLERERSLLISGDTDGLLPLTEEKNERYRQLQRLHDDRAMLLARCGFANADAALRAFCGRLPKVLARWDEALAFAAQAREYNAINGQLIAERMRHNQTALSVLLSAADEAPLYDAGGHSRPTGSGRILGSA